MFIGIEFTSNQGAQSNEASQLDTSCRREAELLVDDLGHVRVAVIVRVALVTRLLITPERAARPALHTCP